jgi:UDP-N-acetylmuramoylalanine--D-glutamate ligase
MRISQLKNLDIGLLGFGREGRATYDALRKSDHRGAVHVFSDHTVEVPEGVEFHLADSGRQTLRGIGLLVRSPGFSPRHHLRQAADAMGLAQTTATNLFLAEARSLGLPVIGITGSKGKTTTSTLAHLILSEARIPSVLVGNVGVPALDLLDKIRREELVTVFELSSYQCADLEDGEAPTLACLLDLFPEHMDWHGSVEAYYEAKARIRAAQRPTDPFRYNARSLEPLKRALRATSSVCSAPAAQPINTPAGLHFADGWFRRQSERLVPDTGMLLGGHHNRENATAAFSVVEPLGATPDHLQRALQSFRGLPFRLQDEGEHGGIRWINDSLSTAPEVVAVALRALKSSVTTLIAGGYDRGYDQRPMIEALTKSSVKTLIVVPDTGRAIAAMARIACPHLDVREAASLDEAVSLALESTPAGTTCLFSPGAPSYNAYGSFEERGKHFRTLVNRTDS